MLAGERRAHRVYLILILQNVDAAVSLPVLRIQIQALQLSQVKQASGLQESSQHPGLTDDDVRVLGSGIGRVLGLFLIEVDTLNRAVEQLLDLIHTVDDRVGDIGAPLFRKPSGYVGIRHREHIAVQVLNLEGVLVRLLVDVF